MQKVREEGVPRHPLWVYPIILREYDTLQHNAILHLRDLTELEEHRAEYSESRKLTVYARLHEIARWTITVCEMLEVNQKTYECMIQCHEDFVKHTSTLTAGIPSIPMRRIRQDLEQHVLMTSNLYRRCASYQERMRNVIQLVFNIVAQNEARSSMAIAVAMKADGQIMKATSLIALLFLPPTFISAVFSTTFFEFGADSQSWGVSQEFWIYWAVVVPVTLMCLVVWYKWFAGGTAIFPGRIKNHMVEQRGVEWVI